MQNHFVFPVTKALVTISLTVFVAWKILNSSYFNDDPSFDTADTELVCVDDYKSTDNLITVHAYFQPLILERSLKDFKSTNLNDKRLFGSLLKWTKPAKDRTVLAARHFGFFLPPEHDIHVGKIWWIVPSKSKNSDEQLSNFRYQSDTTPGLECFKHLFSLFHPKPFLETRFKPDGSIAILRAENEELFDIYFRAHVEFQIEEAPYYPFWFTPAQFQGRIVIKTDLSEVIWFEMKVPNNRHLNVDMEWLNGPNEKEDMEVDVGYVRLMMLNLSKLSKVNSDELVNLKGIKWETEIDENQATEMLKTEMYPFKAVSYHNLSSAFELASLNDKLVHALVLYGSLDDQSC